MSRSRRVITTGLCLLAAGLLLTSWQLLVIIAVVLFIGALVRFVRPGRSWRLPMIGAGVSLGLALISYAALAPTSGVISDEKAPIRYCAPDQQQC